ncbi:helix-turn-helix domain-containing protein, partial [Nonomuraea sp. NPDC004297]
MRPDVGEAGGGVGLGRAVPELQAGRGVLHGAFAVLEELAKREEAGLTQLALATGLPKATTHRLLCRLADLGEARPEHRLRPPVQTVVGAHHRQRERS